MPNSKLVRFDSVPHQIKRPGVVLNSLLAVTYKQLPPPQTETHDVLPDVPG